MKNLKLKAYSDGSLQVIENDLIFYIENDAAQIEVDFSEAEVSGLRKWVDFKMSDGTGTTRPELIDFTTGDILIVNIDNTMTKTGPLEIQPFANDPVTEQRVSFDVIKLLVQPSLNILNDTAYPDPTALEAALANKIDLNGLNSVIDELHFDITPTSTDALTEGQLRWNATDKTLDIGMDGDGIVQQVGMETYYPTCINDDSVTIPDGALVMFSGSVGNSGLIKIKRVSTTMPLPALGMGIATEAIAVGAQGRITWFGLVRGIQTNGANYGETWVDGSVLYNSGTITGGLSIVKPIAPKSAMIAGIVVNANPSNGILFARPTFFPFLGQLSDVAITTPITGDILVYNTATLRWENSSKLSQPRWDDLFFPLSQSKLGANLKPDFDYTNNGLLFPRNDTSEYVWITVQMPHSWLVGSTIEPHLHYTQNANTQPVFTLEYRWTNIGAAVPGTWTTISLNTNTQPYVLNGHQILNGASISGTGKNISSILDIKLYRNDNVYVGDLLAKQFDIHYQVDGFGSQQEYIKT